MDRGSQVFFVLLPEPTPRIVWCEIGIPRASPEGSVRNGFGIRTGTGAGLCQGRALAHSPSMYIMWSLRPEIASRLH